MSNVREFLKGKRVCLVGPAESAIGQGCGDLIESYDVVARIKSFDFSDEYHSDLGRRTDILFTDRILHKSDGYVNIGKKPKGRYYENHKVFEDKNIKYVICNFPADHPVYTQRISTDFEGLKRNTSIPVINTNSDRFYSVRNFLSRPNAGLIAIVELLGYDISELFTIGLDFFRTGYNESNFNNFLKRDLINVWHKNSDFGEYHWVDKQYLFFKYNLMVNDRRIKVDKVFSEILSEDSKDFLFEMQNLTKDEKMMELQQIKSFDWS